MTNGDIKCFTGIGWIHFLLLQAIFNFLAQNLATTGVYKRPSILICDHDTSPQVFRKCNRLRLPSTSSITERSDYGRVSILLHQTNENFNNDCASDIPKSSLPTERMLTFLQLEDREKNPSSFISQKSKFSKRSQLIHVNQHVSQNVGNSLTHQILIIVLIIIELKKVYLWNITPRQTIQFRPSTTIGTYSFDLLTKVAHKFQKNN